MFEMILRIAPLLQAMVPLRAATFVVEHQPVSFALAAVAVTIAVFPVALRAAGAALLQRFGRLFPDLVIEAGVKVGVPGENRPTALQTLWACSRSVRLGVVTAFLLLVSSVAYAAYRYGQTNPIPGTVLLMPERTCARGGSHLILFIHGWRGDAAETWRDFPNLVCQDESLADADVLSIGYPTFLIGPNPSMEDTGQWLADKLAANGISRYTRIAIVAHSIGGLLARRIVLEQRPELASVGLLVEMATPHEGPANYAQLIASIGLPGGALVQELQQGSPFLSTLTDRWRQLPVKPITHCWGSPNDWLVSVRSAQANCDHPHVLPALDHRGLVKPSGPREDTYAIPMNEVRQYLHQ